MSCRTCQVCAIMLEFSSREIERLRKENCTLRQQLQIPLQADPHEFTYAHDFDNGIVTASTPIREDVNLLKSPLLGSTSLQLLKIRLKHSNRVKDIYELKTDHVRVENGSSERKGEDTLTYLKPCESRSDSPNADGLHWAQIEKDASTYDVYLADTDIDESAHDAYLADTDIDDVDTDVTCIDKRSERISHKMNISGIEPAVSSSILKFGGKEKVSHKKREEERQSFLTSFDIPPNWRQRESQKPYRYKPGPIRGAQRKLLQGWSCPKCEEAYKMALGTDTINTQCRQLIQRCSKHRGKHNPISNTPEGYWDFEPLTDP